MKKNRLFIVLAAIGLLSCAANKPVGSSLNSEESLSAPLPSSLEEEISSPSSSAEAISSSQSSTQSSSSKETPLSSSSSNSSSSSSRSSASSYNAGGDTLPNGNRKLPAPDNIASPIDVADWCVYDMKETLPDYWSFIYGNNTAKPNFYASSHGGGIRMDQIRKGLQSPAFTSWKKLEVRVAISSVNNNSTKVNSQKNLPTMLVYGYDSNANLIVQDEIAEGSINANTKEVRFYLRNENMAYFELRLNAFPYKGSQCYNFGIGGISVKGWDYL